MEQKREKLLGVDGKNGCASKLPYEETPHIVGIGSETLDGAQTSTGRFPPFRVVEKLRRFRKDLALFV